MLYTFQPNLEFRSVLRPGGRTGVGARNHCIHGKDVAMVENVLDWHPFDYLTVEQNYMGIRALITCQLTPTSDGRGTRLTVHMTGQMPVPRFLNRPAFLFMHTKVYPMAKLYARMAQVMAEATAGESTDELALAPAV